MSNLFEVSPQKSQISTDYECAQLLQFNSIRTPQLFDSNTPTQQSFQKTNEYCTQQTPPLADQKPRIKRQIKQWDVNKENSNAKQNKSQQKRQASVNRNINTSKQYLQTQKPRMNSQQKVQSKQSINNSVQLLELDLPALIAQIIRTRAKGTNVKELQYQRGENRMYSEVGCIVFWDGEGTINNQQQQQQQSEIAWEDRELANGGWIWEQTCGDLINIFKLIMNCHFCQGVRLRDNDGQQLAQSMKVSLHQRLTYTLYQKYAESQNYYYTKEINEILTDQQTKTTIVYKDLQVLDEPTEYLKKIYYSESHAHKLHVLNEFYKFHKDLPRWAVQQPIVNILNEYYNKKRKIEYFKIQKLIEFENQQNPDRPAKGIVGDQPNETESTPQSSSQESGVVGNVLDGLVFTDQKPEQPCTPKVSGTSQFLKKLSKHEKLRTDRGVDPFLVSDKKQQQPFIIDTNIQNIKNIVSKQRRQLQIKDPDQCDKLEINIYKTKHQEILEQLHKRVQEKIHVKQNKNKEPKREVKSVHVEIAKKKENFFKSPKGLLGSPITKLATPKSCSKPMKVTTSVHDSESKRIYTGCTSSRAIDAKITFRKPSKLQVQKQQGLCKTLTTPRTAVQKK